MLADVLTIDEDILHGGGAIQDEVEAPPLIRGIQAELVAVPARGVVRQAGLAENVGDGDLLPIGGNGGCHFVGASSGSRVLRKLPLDQGCFYPGGFPVSRGFSPRGG